MNDLASQRSSGYFIVIAAEVFLLLFRQAILGVDEEVPRQ
jgi:hypothetical protein